MKHAYLIMAHENDALLQKLITTLDDSRNDIFVHLDSKFDIDLNLLKVNFSNLYIIPERINGAWGDFSLVKIEINLIKNAMTHEGYEYLHLLSGSDLPIKSQNYIHSECRRLNGCEFIGFARDVNIQELTWRAHHWFLFSRSFKSKSILKRALRRLFNYLQSSIHFRRFPKEVKKGSQWWSITAEFAQYILENESLIHKYFINTLCPDEMVFQTICWNSKFKKNIFNTSNEFEGCKRYIPWRNGELKKFNELDYFNMKKGEAWFARKFTLKDLTSYEQIFHN